MNMTTSLFLLLSFKTIDNLCIQEISFKVKASVFVLSCRLGSISLTWYIVTYLKCPVEGPWEGELLQKLTTTFHGSIIGYLAVITFTFNTFKIIPSIIYKSIQSASLSRCTYHIFLFHWICQTILLFWFAELINLLPKQTAEWSSYCSMSMICRVKSVSLHCAAHYSVARWGDHYCSVVLVGWLFTLEIWDTSEVSWPPNKHD